MFALILRFMTFCYIFHLPLFIDMYVFLGFIYIFISLPLAFLPCFFNLLCNSALEQGHLEPWRYGYAFIIIIIIR